MERKFFLTVRAQHREEFEALGATLVHRFQPAQLWLSRCCAPPERGELIETVVVSISSGSRREWERDHRVRRVRTSPPSGGWGSLERKEIWTTIC